MTQLFRDGARGELQTAINSSATTLSVSNGELFSIATVGTGALSSGDWFKAVLQSGAQFEIVYVRSHETVSLPDTFTNVLRGQDGTTAQAFPAGTVFGIRPTAGDMDKAINQREPSQAAGSAGHYWDGTKTWKPLNSAAVGLSLVNNTSDEDKPVSTAQQQALDTKVTSVAGKGLSTEDYSTAEKNKLADVAANATANSTDAALRDRTTHTGSQAISTVTGLQTALDDKQATLVSGSNLKTVGGVALLGSGDIPIGGALPAAMSLTYTSDRVTKITEDGVDTNITYNSNGTVNTISYPVGAKTRTETYNYTSGQLTGMTATEV